MKIISRIQEFNKNIKVQELREQYEAKSFVDILSVTRREMSHSAFLVELLKDDSFHGLGSIPMHLFMELLLRRALQQNTKTQEGGEEVMFSEFKSAILSRKLHFESIEVDKEVSFEDADDNKGRVDILAKCGVSPVQRLGSKNKAVKSLNLIIENKIYAGEQDCQTDKYYKHFNALLKNSAKNVVVTNNDNTGPRSRYNVYVYLTPKSGKELDKLQTPECNCKEFIQICYQDILDDIIDPLLNMDSLSARARFILEEYKRSLGASFANVELNGDNCKRKWKTIVMAMGKKEVAEILDFWSNYRDLISAAINEYNREADEDSDSEDNNGRTYYDYNGQPFCMGRLVEAIISEHAEKYEHNELNQKFGDIVSRIVSGKKNSSYFDEQILTKDYLSVYVFKQWNATNFPKFCQKVKEFGWYELKEYKECIPSREESLILCDFYKKHEKLITTVLEVIKMFAEDDKDVKIAEAFAKRNKSTRDRTTYSLVLVNRQDNTTIPKLSWGRLVMNILHDYIEDATTYDEVLSTFGLKDSDLKKFQNETKGYSGFFTEPTYLLQLMDGEYCVKKGWQPNQLKTFISRARECGYEISEDKE